MLLIAGAIVGFLVLVEVLALIRLTLHVGMFAKYWEQQNNASEGEVLYVALGDSAAQGLGASNPDKGYVGLIARALAAKPGKTVQTANVSVSGAKIQDVTQTQLPKLNNLKLTDETIITLEIGANDMLRFNEQSFRGDMDQLLAQMPKQTVVAEVPYFGGGRYRAYEKNVLVANKAIHELAEKYGLRVAPLYQVTKSRDSLKVYAADLFHPSNTGYKNWADAFKQVLGLSS